MPISSSVYINPLTDFGFKYIFGREADKEFTLSFLNALGVGGNALISDVDFIDKEKKGEHKDDRALIYDMHCKLDDGTKLIVEMQNRYQTHFDDRALYYLAADLYAQGEKGDSWNYRLTRVHGIFLMNFEWKGVKEQHLREDVCLYNMQTRSLFSDKLRMTFLKMPLMVKLPEDCRTTLEKWLYILKNMENMETMPEVFLKEPIFQRLGKIARIATLNDRDRKAYKESLKVYRDNYAIAETEREEGRAEGLAEGLAKGKAEGIAEGIAKGIAKGKAEGIAEGIAKGKAEGKAEEREKYIHIMLSIGISSERIASELGVSPEEILKLANNE